MARRTTWILVADASRARLFATTEEDTYEEIQGFEHPDSRARVRELMADANGRKPGGQAVTTHPAGIGRPGAAPDTNAKEVEHLKFAGELCDVLKQGLNEHSYDSLILVAPPHFLGLLRDKLDPQVEKHLEGHVDKDYLALDPRELQQRVEARKAA